MKYHVADGERLSDAVIHAVSAYTNIPPEDLQQLARSIEPDALESLFSSSVVTQQSNGIVAFDYQGTYVTIEVHDEPLITVSETPPLPLTSDA